MGCRPAYIALCIILLTAPVTASGVGIEVNEQSSADITVLEKDIRADAPSHWLLEASNTGSIPVTAQLRLDIQQDNQTVFRTWSDQSVLDPGDTLSREFAFFQPSLDGTVTARPVLHHGIETEQAENDTFTVASQETRQGFNITKTRLYNDRLHLGIQAPESVEKMHVTARGQSARRFEQQIIDDPDTATFVDLEYSPPIKTPREIHLAISGNTGRYHYTTTIEPEPLDGIKAAFFRLLDSLLE